MHHANTAEVPRDPHWHRRIALRLACALFLASALLFARGWSVTPGAAPIAHACCTGTFYGANSTKVDNATQYTWPQGSGPYCGIETAIAITNYADQDAGISMKFTSSSSQNSVASDNTSSFAESQWGYVLASGNPVGGKSNISLDYGTDPRSIAYMSWNYTPGGYYFHNYIYRWQFVHGSQPSHSQQVLEATSVVGAQLETYHQPLSVAINAGAHSILVTGVYSTNEPLYYFPANITGLTYRDPQNSNHVTVDIGTWTNGIAGGYSLWSPYYGNPQDPEPSIGTYKPGANQVHWYSGFNWISRDGHSDYWSPDWAYTAYPGSRMTAP